MARENLDPEQRMGRWSQRMRLERGQGHILIPDLADHHQFQFLQDLGQGRDQVLIQDQGLGQDQDLGQDQGLGQDRIQDQDLDQVLDQGHRTVLAPQSLNIIQDQGHHQGQGHLKQTGLL